MPNQAYKYKIRPHHLLCMLGYRGLGYNKKFALNMKNIISDLRTNPSIKIIVLAQADDFCTACPHNKEGNCVQKPDSGENVQNLDLQYLKLLQIQLGDPLSINNVWSIISSSISLKNMENICNNCDWWSYGYCREGLQQLKYKVKCKKK